MLAVGVSAAAMLAKRPASAPEARADRTFTFSYSVEIPPPAGSDPIDVFVPLAASDPHQDVLRRELKASIPGQENTEGRYGNRFWHGLLDRSDRKPITVEVDYLVRRHVFHQARLASTGTTVESPEERKELGLYLGPDRLVSVSVPFIDKVRADTP